MKKWIYLVGVLVLLASCVNEIMDEEVLNKQVNDSATRAVPITSELRCEITTPAPMARPLKKPTIILIRGDDDETAARASLPSQLPTMRESAAL